MTANPPGRSPLPPRDPTRGVTAREPACLVSAGVVPPLAAGFTLRHDSMPRLDEALAPGSAVALVPAGITGADPSGWAAVCGKTQLAVQAARTLRQSGTVDLVIWAGAHRRIAVLDGYARAAADLGLSHACGAEAAAARLAAWLRETSRRWLLVLDDLRDAADLDGLWPAGPAGTVLITAADPDTVAAMPVRALPVPMLSEREAVGYLSGQLSADPGHRAGQMELASELGGEPAALAHAAAVIAGSDLTCRDYQDIFSGLRGSLETAAGTRMPATAVTWRLSAQHACILEPDAGTWPLLVLAALLDGHAIPLTLFTSPATCQYLSAGQDHLAAARQAQAAVRALTDAGLLVIDTSGTLPVARMSTALQQAVRVTASPDLLEEAAQAAAGALLQAWPKDEPGSPAAALLCSCAVSLHTAAGDWLRAGGTCHRVLTTAGRSLGAAGMPGPAAAWWEELADGNRRVLGDDHPDTIVAGGLLAEALLVAGKPSEAVSWAEWVRASRAVTLGADHRGTIAAAVCLGRALAAAGRPGDAVTVLDQAAGQCERAYGAGDDATISARDACAAACLAAGNPAGAVRSLQRSLAGLQGDHGADHPAVLATVARLAAAQAAAGQLGDAIAGWQQVLARCERAHGADHPDTLAARAGLAGACGAAGQMDAALYHYRQASAGYERAFGAAHPDTLACRAGLARAHFDAGQLGDAITLLRSALQLAERTLPPGDPAADPLRGVLAEITGQTAAR
jgi:tetratricopeptide (TPR) repeat protein